jgi:thiamine biosynthesis lipoprotein
VHAEGEFRVMGTNAHVIVGASSAATARAWMQRAVDRLHGLDARWSRFVSTSEVSRLNAAEGAPVMVSADTRRLVVRAIDGWRRTAGLFDPTVHDALVALGYDRDFDSIDRDTAASDDLCPTPAPGCAGIVVDRVAGSVRMPRGVRFDPGGIGKGLAADMVVDDLVRSGVDGVCVNVGGDLRVEGTALGSLGGSGGWLVDLDHPTTGAGMGRVRLRAGAVASTWRTRRSWGAPGAPRHHLVDPRVGAPVRSGLAGVTVIAARGWWAEVMAKAAFVAGPGAGAAMLAASALSGYLVDDDGYVHAAGPIAEFAA